jgi:membrane associated rhomboid family serine protease
MENIATTLPILIPLLILGILLGLTQLRARQDRRRIMADGVSAHAIVTKIDPPAKDGSRQVHFSFQKDHSGNSIQGKQAASGAAVEALAISVGSSVQVHYIDKWASSAFIDSLLRKERMALSPGASLFYVSFLAPNGFNWSGNGEVAITGEVIRFTALKRRPFWFGKKIEREFTQDCVSDVEQADNRVRLKLLIPGEKPRALVMRAVNAAEAAAIAAGLPALKTARFVPVMGERAAFESSLLLVTPRTPVTLSLVAVNVFMFCIATALGAGLFAVAPAVLIRLGSDYTPLTLDGQWWRLFTSTFLHFGLFHVALNMWALYVNGRVAERIYGSLRYLIIYLAAGVSGSLASFLWHPIVNGAGASGAIFGVFGALIAFFLKRDRGVPPSVIKTQLTSTSIFVAYSILNAARYQGIDNAAHLGGLLSGFLLGFILARPVDESRNAKPWTAQWAIAGALAATVFAVIGHQLMTGALTPRLARDNSGKPIPLAGLLPIQSMGGFRLGMTRSQVRALKGVPIHSEGSAWVYNAIDSAHDGVLTIFFDDQKPRNEAAVAAIEFMGHDKESAPSGLPYFNSLSVSEVISKYGQPADRTTSDQTTLFWFRNAVFVATSFDGKIYRYGISDHYVSR